MLRCTGGGRSGSLTAKRQTSQGVRSTFSTGRHGSGVPIAGVTLALRDGFTLVSTDDLKSRYSLNR
jgi:hypothetical protein